MPSITNLHAFIFVLCCGFGSVFTQLVVHSPPQIAGTYVVSTLTFKGTPAGLIGTTINGTLLTVSNPNSMSNIMLAPYQGIPATDYVIRNYQVFLPSVIVLITNRLEYPGINEFIVEDYQSTDDLIIPVVDIGLEDGFNLFGFLGDNQTAEISLTFSPNIWAEPRQSGVWIAAQILILAGSATCVILCFVKLHKFVQVGGFQFSIAQVCLVILAYANLFTIFHWIVDPTVTRKIMPAGLFSPFFSYPFPFILLAALLTIAYWHELISMANLTVSPFLTKLTKPFFITSILLLLLEYAICIIRAVGGVDLIANIIYQALFLLVNIPTAIYFAWISIKVLIFLSGKALDKKKKRFRKAAVCLSFTFLGLLGRIFLLAYIFGGPTALPIGFFTIFWMAAVFGIMTSLALIFSYQPQHKKKLLGSSTSTGKSTKMDRPPTLSAEV